MKKKLTSAKLRTVAATVLGANQFTEQGRKRSYSRDKGWVEVRTYKGPRALTAAKEQDLIDQLDPESLSTQEGVPTQIELTVPLPGGTSISIDQQEEKNIVWELIPVPFERALGLHGYFNDSQVRADDVEKIEEAIRRGEASKVRTSYAGTQNLLDYIDLRVRGTESFKTYSWTMRCSLSTRRSSALKASMTNVGRVVSYAEAIGSTPVNPNATPITTSGLHWAQPTIRHYTNWQESAVYGAGWQDIPVGDWLKNAPEVRESNSGGRRVIEIVQTYDGFVSLSNVIYPRTTAAGTGVLVGVAGKSTKGARR